jgi:hypothetical protein
MSSSMGSSMALRLSLSIQRDTWPPTTKHRDRPFDDEHAKAAGYNSLLKMGQITALRIVMDWINYLPA